MASKLRPFEACVVALALGCPAAYAQAVGPLIQWIEPGMSPTELTSDTFKREKDEIRFTDSGAACIASIAIFQSKETITHVQCDTTLSDPEAKMGPFGPKIRKPFFDKHVQIYEGFFGIADQSFSPDMVIWRNRVHGIYTLSLRNYIETPLVLRFEKTDIRLIPARKSGFEAQ